MNNILKYSEFEDESNNMTQMMHAVPQSAPTSDDGTVMGRVTSGRTEATSQGSKFPDSNSYAPSSRTH